MMERNRLKRGRDRKGEAHRQRGQNSLRDTDGNKTEIESQTKR